MKPLELLERCRLAAHSALGGDNEERAAWAEAAASFGQLEELSPPRREILRAFASQLPPAGGAQLRTRRQCHAYARAWEALRLLTG